MEKAKRMLIVLAIILVLAACGQADSVSEDFSANKEAVETDQVVESEENDSEQAVDLEEEKGEPDMEQEENNHVDEPKEMIDWEIFATQADSNEICMVVSNESTGFQKVLGINPEERDPNFLPTETYWYTYQDGDRFAIPINGRNITIIDVGSVKNGLYEYDKGVMVNIEGEDCKYYDRNDKYVEIELSKNEDFLVVIQYMESKGDSDWKTKMIAIEK